MKGAAMMNRMRAILLAAPAALLLAGSLGAAQELKISGYFKNFSTVFHLPQPADSAGAPDQPLLGLSQTRLRLTLSYAPSPSVSVLVAYDISPRIQDPFFFKASPFVASPAAGDYRLADFRTPLVPGPDDPMGSFGLYHNLDRLSVTVKMKFGDLIIGRQPVAWGSGRVTNPTDVIAPFTFHELDKEERFGVDAVRMKVPLGRLSELDFGYVFGRDFRFNSSAFFLKAKVNALKTDVSVLLLGFQEDVLVGLDVARSLGGSGVWLEAAYVFPGALNRDQPKGDDYVRLTAGIDRSLSGRLYGFLEYHYSSAGASRPADYISLFSQPAYTRGTAYLLGRHYLSAGLTFQVSPLIPFTGLVIWNVSDGSLAISPQAEYNVAENIYLGAGAYLGLGRAPGTSLFAGPPLVPDLRSEFGSYPDFVFVSFRVYF
jgi:hypothetical protein